MAWILTRLTLLLLLGLAAVAPVRAADPGEALFTALAAAPTETAGRAAEDRIWRRWILAPEPEAQRLIDEAMRRRDGWDLAGSAELLDRLVDRWPDFSEGWNQRATVRYMQGLHDLSLADIAETLRREPRHFGAMAGKALILMARGDGPGARKALEAAVALHPWLRERDLIDQLPRE